MNIGNLILLEVKLNHDAGQLDYRTKATEYYSQSQYKWIHDFIDLYSEWDQSMIAERALKMAQTFYQEILITQTERDEALQPV